MRREFRRQHSPLKFISLGFTALGLLLAQLANAQTPVSARMNISGSCASCDLSNRVMPRLSLQGSDFSGSNFAHSNISGGKFHRSNLSGASFHKAYLMRVEGEHINMRGVNFRDASLVEAKLINANISYADLHRADLTNANFSNSQFNYSEIISADAMNTRFFKADFSNAHLTHSDFTNADFTSAIFENTKFGDAILKNAVFAGANLSGADLLNVQGLSQSQLDLACGNTETKLPSNLSISVCPLALQPSVEATFIAPRLEYRAYILPQNQPTMIEAAPVTVTVAENLSSIDLALIEIEATLRDLPISSPLHKRLTKSRILLHQAQTNGSK